MYKYLFCLPCNRETVEVKVRIGAERTVVATCIYQYYGSIILHTHLPAANERERRIMLALINRDAIFVYIERVGGYCKQV